MMSGEWWGKTMDSSAPRRRFCSGNWPDRSYVRMHSFLVVSRLFALAWIGQKRECFVLFVVWGGGLPAIILGFMSLGGVGGVCSSAGVWACSEHAIFLLLVFSIGHGLDRFSIKQW